MLFGSRHATTYTSFHPSVSDCVVRASLRRKPVFNRSRSGGAAATADERASRMGAGIAHIELCQEVSSKRERPRGQGTAGVRYYCVYVASWEVWLGVGVAKASR